MEWYLWGRAQGRSPKLTVPKGTIPLPKITAYVYMYFLQHFAGDHCFSRGKLS